MLNKHAAKWNTFTVTRINSFTGQQNWAMYEYIVTNCVSALFWDERKKYYDIEYTFYGEEQYVSIKFAPNYRTPRLSFHCKNDLIVWFYHKKIDCENYFAMIRQARRRSILINLSKQWLTFTSNAYTTNIYYGSH